MIDMKNSETPDTNKSKPDRLARYFNMPLYINPKGKGSTIYYCGKIYFENNMPIIEIYKIKRMYHEPIEGVFHSSQISRNTLNECIDCCTQSTKQMKEPNSNNIYPAIITLFRSRSIGVNMSEYDEHLVYIYSRNNSDNGSIQDLSVFYVSGRFVPSNSDNKHYVHTYVLFVVPKEIYERINGLLNLDENISIKVIDNTKNSTYFIKTNYISKNWRLSGDMKTYPLIISMPFDISFELHDTLYSTDKLDIKMTSTSIKEKQVGSIVNYRVSSFIYRQLPFIAFNPGYISSDKVSPTNILVDPGLLLFEIKIKENFLNGIKSSIVNYIIDAIEKTELRKYIEINRHDNFDELRDFVKSVYGHLNIKIDPKALMKSLLYGTEHLKYISVMVGSNNASINKAKIKNKILREFTRNYIKCFDKELPEYLCKEHSEINFVYLCFTRVKKFEEELYRILRHSTEYKKQGLSSQSSLIAGYLRVLFNKINKLANTNVALKIEEGDLWKLVDALTLKLIELGAHGIAHLLRKIIASYLNIQEKDLGYFLIFKSQLYNTMYGEDKDVLIDGYVLRHNTSTLESHSQIVVTIGIYLRKHHSYYYLKTHLLSTEERKNEFINYIKNKINSIISLNDIDQCYMKYLDKAPIAKASLNVALSSSKSSINLELIENLVSQYVDVYGKGIPETGNNIEDAIYIPLSELRRLISKSVEEYNENKQTVNKIDLEELRTYMPGLLEYLTPVCFDGCYGCILSRDCNSRSPLIKEWIVSKYMTKLLINYFMEGSSS